MKNEAVYWRKVNENPCNMCMPMGGILPFMGIEKAMVIIHGSQGCSTYMRRHMAEHFNEPVDVASSSLDEKGTIYGGESNLKKGLDNLIKVYNPGMVGVLSACLAETIGEDIRRITADYLLERELVNFPIVAVSTPGYGGTHTEGYFLAVKEIIVKLAWKKKRHSRINVLVPNLSPADIREIKRILQLMGTQYILFPDFSDNLDRPFSRPYKKLPEEGTKITDLEALPGAAATIQFGVTLDEHISPGKYLETSFGVPLYNLPVPMGVENTDLFIGLLKQLTGNPVPETLKKERGRLLDCMVDSHKYNFQGRSVIFGEPENVYAVVITCLENGIHPAVMATGDRGGKLAEILKERGREFRSDFFLLSEADFSQIRGKSREMAVNIAIGHSDGRFLTEKEGIPLVRHGFPIHDRVGGQRLLSVGYAGTTMFLDRVTNVLLENKYGNYRSLMYRKFYQGIGK